MTNRCFQIAIGAMGLSLMLSVVVWVCDPQSRQFLETGRQTAFDRASALVHSADTTNTFDPTHITVQRPPSDPRPASPEVAPEALPAPATDLSDWFAEDTDSISDDHRARPTIADAAAAPFRTASNSDGAAWPLIVEEAWQPRQGDGGYIELPPPPGTLGDAFTPGSIAGVPIATGRPATDTTPTQADLDAALYLAAMNSRLTGIEQTVTDLMVGKFDRHLDELTRRLEQLDEQQRNLAHRTPTPSADLPPLPPQSPTAQAIVPEPATPAERPRITITPAGEGLITLQAEAAPLPEVIRVLADATQTNIISGPAADGTVTGRLANVTPLQALEAVLRSQGLALERDGDVAYVRPQSVGIIAANPSATTTPPVAEQSPAGQPAVPSATPAQPAATQHAATGEIAAESAIDASTAVALDSTSAIDLEIAVLQLSLTGRFRAGLHYGLAHGGLAAPAEGPHCAFCGRTVVPNTPPATSDEASSHVISEGYTGPQGLLWGQMALAPGELAAALPESLRVRQLSRHDKRLDAGSSLELAVTPGAGPGGVEIPLRNGMSRLLISTSLNAEDSDAISLELMPINSAGEPLGTTTTPISIAVGSTLVVAGDVAEDARDPAAGDNAERMQVILLIRPTIRPQAIAEALDFLPPQR